MFKSQTKDAIDWKQHGGADVVTAGNGFRYYHSR